MRTWSRWNLARTTSCITLSGWTRWKGVGLLKIQEYELANHSSICGMQKYTNVYQSMPISIFQDVYIDCSEETEILCRITDNSWPRRYCWKNHCWIILWTKKTPNRTEWVVKLSVNHIMLRTKKWKQNPPRKYKIFDLVCLWNTIPWQWLKIVLDDKN